MPDIKNYILMKFLEKPNYRGRKKVSVKLRGMKERDS